MTNTLARTIKNSNDELGQLSASANEFLGSSGIPAEVVFAVDLALEEMITNIIKYGYDDEGEHEIGVRIEVEQERVSITIEDDGHEFNPLQAPPAETDKPLEERSIGGLGIHLVLETMDEVVYERRNGRNVLVMKVGPWKQG